MDKIYEQIPTILEVLKVVKELVDWVSTPTGAITSLVTGITFVTVLVKKFGRRAR